MPRTTTVLVEEIVRETDQAFCCSIDGAEYWVPKSVIEEADEYQRGNEECELEVAAWFADKELP